LKRKILLSTPSPSWIPPDVPLDRPNVARMYDYYLGGHHNFAVDRQAAEAAMAIYPDLPLVMRANRAFLRRAVQFFLEQGVTQFLDVGSGIPTVGNVHELALQAEPAARVVYVDVDPVAVAHSQALIGAHPQVAVVRGDMRSPREVLEHPDVQRLLDWERPVAVLLLLMLHFVPDDADAQSVVGALRDAVPPGSYLAITHASHADIPQATKEQMLRLYSRTSSPITARSKDQIARLFDGLELAEPGLVYLPDWRPEGSEDLLLDEPQRTVTLAGVGRKPDRGSAGHDN
jgi:hypothetical protein